MLVLLYRSGELKFMFGTYTFAYLSVCVYGGGGGGGGGEGGSKGLNHKISRFAMDSHLKTSISETKGRKGVEVYTF